MADLDEPEVMQAVSNPVNDASEMNLNPPPEQSQVAIKQPFTNLNDPALQS